MKKLLLILPIFLFCFSCSDSENDLLLPTSNDSRPGPVDTRIDRTKLARVKFYPGTTHERIWYFYPNGLLKKIVNPDGTIIQDFFYDSRQNLTLTNFYGDTYFTGSPYIAKFKYDSANHIVAINELPVAYNAVANRYDFNIDFFSYQVHLKSDLSFFAEYLMLYDTDDEGNPFLSAFGGSQIIYSDIGNVSILSQINDPSYEHHLYDNHVNPLKAATDPLRKSLSIINFGAVRLKYLLSEYASQNNQTRVFYDWEEADNDHDINYDYNVRGLPVTRRIENPQTHVFSVDALYYYQGDVIPHN